MDVPVDEAQAQLLELVRRAEDGEDIVLTRQGRPAVRLEPVRKLLTPEDRKRIIEEAKSLVPPEARNGPSAARSQDFLYNEDGLPH